MKTCLCCGAESDIAKNTCAACGEASWSVFPVAGEPQREKDSSESDDGDPAQSDKDLQIDPQVAIKVSLRRRTRRP